MSYYFEWYNALTGNHIAGRNPFGELADYLTDHPDYSQPVPLGPGGYIHRPSATYFTPPAFSYTDPGWHAREVQRISSAGIDVMLPVYRGSPDNAGGNVGAEKLNEALNALENRGWSTPKIGLFIASSAFGHLDLKTADGKNSFYGIIRDFYSLFRPSRWFRYEKNAVVWIYSSLDRDKIDPKAFTQASDRFAKDFGGVRLLFIGDQGWGNAHAPISLTYQWGAAAAQDGVILRNVAEIGPGFDERGWWPRDHPRVFDRQQGARYQRAWDKTFQSGAKIAAIETWNEYHEGTDVSPSYEYGWEYWKRTRANAARHHRNAPVPLFRYYNGLDHFYTTDWSELESGRGGYQLEGTQCGIYPLQRSGTVPLYRYYNSSIGDHLYTTNWSEYGNGRAGYRYQGTACYVYPKKTGGAAPLYRYHHVVNGDHFYTTNWNELGSGRFGYHYDGIQAYVIP